MFFMVKAGIDANLRGNQYGFIMVSRLWSGQGEISCNCVRIVAMCQECELILKWMIADEAAPKGRPQRGEADVTFLTLHGDS
jgi:hypothetical protein